MELEVGGAGLEHDVALEVENLLELTQRHVEHEPDAARQRLEEPDVHHRRGELDMAHPLAPHLGQGDLDAAFLANDAAEFHPFVFAAKTLIVLDRPEDAGAEEPVPLWLEGAVIDGLGLLDLAKGPALDLLRRGDVDPDPIKRLCLADLSKNPHQFVHDPNPLSRSPTALFCQSVSAARHPAHSLDDSSSTLRASDLSSLTRTLKLSGIPASNVSCSRTIAS